MEPTRVKDWWQSKTFWVNALTLIVSILTAVAGSQFLEQHPEVLLAITGLAIPIINIVLRWLTDEPISSIGTWLDKYRPWVKPNRDKSSPRVALGKPQNHALKT